LKLPIGKVSDTINGGEDSIKGLVDKLVGAQFTGYLEVKHTLEEGECIGQLVFKEGEGVLAEHSIAGQAALGDPAGSDPLPRTRRCVGIARFRGCEAVH